MCLCNHANELCKNPNTWDIIFAYPASAIWFRLPLFFLFPQDERSRLLELNILLIFFQKLGTRVWARLRSNFNTQKSNFVRSYMELLFITNMLSSSSYARPYLTFKYFYHKFLHVTFCSHHISVTTLLREVFYFIESTLMLFFIEGLYN